MNAWLRQFISSIAVNGMLRMMLLKNFGMKHQETSAMFSMGSFKAQLLSIIY